MSALPKFPVIQKDGFNMDLQLIRCSSPTPTLKTLWLMMTAELNTSCASNSIHRPVKDVIEDIKSGRGLSFGTGKLRELCRLLPDDGEVFDSCF